MIVDPNIASVVEWRWVESFLRTFFMPWTYLPIRASAMIVAISGIGFARWCAYRSSR